MMAVKELAWASDVEGPFVVLFKSGEQQIIQSIDGGGMMLGDEPDSSYEVHATDADGEPITILQAMIAAVIQQSSGEQVEFGNPLMATHAGHPRGTRG
jgi:hypothetical protein